MEEFNELIERQCLGKARGILSALSLFAIAKALCMQGIYILDLENEDYKNISQNQNFMIAHKRKRLAPGEEKLISE